VSILLLSGCTSSHYRQSADKEVYGIIQGIDNQVFGRTNAFTIDTPYSGRDPKTIPPNEIIEGRMATNRLILNLDQALQIAVKNSREYQAQKEQLYLTALTRRNARTGIRTAPTTALTRARPRRDGAFGARSASANCSGRAGS
jgi:hypothetical protein